MSELLEATGLVKAYGNFVAVEGVDLALPQARLTGIIGPNGAGKTTLVHLLTGMLVPDSGTILFDGVDVTELPIHQRVRRGMSRSFQITSVFESLSVEQNVLVPVLARRGEGARAWRRAEAGEDARDEALALLQQVGLEDFARRRVADLAHGDKRRLEIAMALAPRPRLCLLDEPTTGMDPTERRQIVDLIRRLHDEMVTTFVLIEHDMDVVFGTCDWIAVIHRGGKLTEGEPRDVSMNKQVRSVYLGEEIT